MVGVIAPAGTPDAIVDRLKRRDHAFIKSDSIQKRLASQGARANRLFSHPSDPPAFLITGERDKWGKVLKKWGINRAGIAPASHPTRGLIALAAALRTRRTLTLHRDVRK